VTATIVLCGDRPHIDATEIPDVIAIAGLCRDPARMGTVEIGSSSRIVLVLHPGSYHLPDVQTALRSIDVDPLGAQIMEAAEEDTPLSLAMALRGLRDRASAFAGSSAEHAKPEFPREMTRRGFFRPLAPAYVAAPLLDHTTCAATDGCRACVGVCPQDAYRWQAGKISYDKEACVPCGRCVTTCPTGAIENPVVTSEMIEAQVGALVTNWDEPIGIRFVCSRGALHHRPEWFDIAVPCSSMVPGSWLLACLLIGAGAATAIPCGESGCPLGLDQGAIEANDYASSVLAGCGLESGMVIGESVFEPIGGGGVDDPFARNRAPDVLVALAALTEQTMDVTHPAADMGVVQIDEVVCTMCGQCAKTCPTHALVEAYDGNLVTLSFDARACVNCTQCVSSCPELERGAIAVEGRVSIELLTGGRRDLNRGSVAMCEICGKAIAPDSMMDRIEDVLGEEFEVTAAILRNRCLDCRGRR
jgi:ferredoxin